MHALVDRKLGRLRDLCREHAVARLDLFGSAARRTDFDADVSDLDFLVEFQTPRPDLTRYLEFRDALAALFERPVDLVERKEIENSRNYIRRQRILGEAEPLYAS